MPSGVIVRCVRCPVAAEMAHAKEAPFVDNGDSYVISADSNSSGESTARLVGSRSVDSDATLSEASDAGPAAAGDPL